MVFLASSQLTTSIYCPCNWIIHVNVVVYFCDSMWIFWMDVNLCMFFNICLYMHCHWRFTCLDGGVRIPLTGFAPQHFYVCTKPGLWFSTSYIVIFFMFNDLWWDVMVCFVDIGWTVDPPCLFCWYWLNCWPSLFVLLILVELLTLPVCFVDISWTVDPPCLFCWY